jgi:xylulokinase
MLHWEEGRKAKGAMFGLTLATSSIDIIKAFMESITCDHVMTLSLLASMGESVVRLKAAGGGTRSEWWTQLKADVLGVPIEVVDEAEPGTLGAAMLAGLAIGCYRSLPDGYEQLSTGSGRLFTPNAGRGALYRVRVEEYREIVASLLENVHQEDERS